MSSGSTSSSGARDRAVDELVIDLPDETVVDLLVAEVREVEGVDVEDIRALDGPPEDPAVAALDVAHSIRRRRSPKRTRSNRWSPVPDDCSTPHGPRSSIRVRTVSWPPTATACPNEGWLCAFVLGALAEGSTAGPDELAIAPIRGGKMALVVAATT